MICAQMELARLMPFLEELATADIDDVRPHLRSTFRIHQRLGLPDDLE